MADKPKKQQKWGRNVLFCKHYEATNRREKNKLARLKKHLVRFPDDAGAKAAVDRCVAAIRGY